MPKRALPVLTSTGTPGLQALEGSVRDMGTQIHQQFSAELDGLDASRIPFTATPADWVAPAPTNVADALRRLAAAAGAHPVP